jgi:ribosome-associated toxin RatA of RatAB toxin-antitoxin module
MISARLVNNYRDFICIMEYDDTTIFAFPPQQVFDVVADVERYPEFLPGWRKVKILSREDKHVTVEQEVGFAFLNWRFESRATLDPPYQIDIESSVDPFPDLHFRWSFVPVAGNKTKVSLIVKSSNSLSPQYRFLQGMFSNSSRSLLDRFKERVIKVNLSDSDSKSGHGQESNSTQDH